MANSDLQYVVTLEGTTGFILDTDVLNTGLLGYLTTDISSYVRSASVKRGKSSDLNKFTAGQLTVVLDNRSRAFDPDYVSSPFYGAIVPRRKITFSISAGTGMNKETFTQFTGYVDSWSFDYDLNGDSIATIAASDAFTVFARQIITLTSPTSELSGERIRRVLTNSRVAWDTAKYLPSGGAFTTDAVSYSGNALEYMQSVALSEDGVFYVRGDGVVIFWGWNAFTLGMRDPDRSIYFIDRWESSDPTAPWLPFSNLSVDYGTDQLYNYATVTGAAGTVTSQNTTSQTANGIASVDYAAITAGTAQMQVLADHLVTKYASPISRITNVGVNANGLYSAYPSDSTGLLAVKKLLKAEMGWTIAVTWTPNGIGDATAGGGIIVGKTVTASPERLDVSFDVGLQENRSIQ